MPKYAIIIALAVVIIVFNAIRIAVKSSDHHFECTECGESFQVSFFKYFFTAHSFDGKCSVTCPKCGKTGFMPPLKGKSSGS